MANYDAIDLEWSWDGDYSIDENGDLKDTSADLIESIVQEVRTVIKSESFDWEKDPTVGANLNDFKGEPNNRFTGQAIQDRIKSAISNIGVAQSGDISVRVVPVHNNQVLILVRILAEASPGNSLEPGDLVRVDLVYDTLEDGVFFLLDDQVAKQFE